MTVNLPKLAIRPVSRYFALAAVFTLSACRTLDPSSFDSSIDTRPGTFSNPPALGTVITPRVGSVVCLNELDALGMVRTGFFTQSCQTLTPEMNLIAESIERVDAGEGMVIMIQTTFEGEAAWVPIPWHDWV